MKYAILQVSPEFLVEFCKGSSTPQWVIVTKHPLPHDARFVRAGHDDTGELFLVIESETFDDIPPGERLPSLPVPQFTAVREKEPV
jgi:hypothetical protein